MPTTSTSNLTEIYLQDERAKDDLTLKRVDTDVARRQQIFIRSEKAREHLERVAQEHADEWAEKKRAYVLLFIYEFHLSIILW